MPDDPTTPSGIPLRPVYGPDDLPTDHADRAAPPGAPPFVRGAYSQMYRGKPWRIFQLSGYGSPEELNQRLRFLLDAGETGFIMKRDRVTNDHLYNPDHPEVEARREDVGQTGTVLLSARDVAVAIDGLPIEQSYAHPGAGVVQAAPWCLGSYWIAAKRRGVDFTKLAGTGQSDFFLTYVGCLTKDQIPPHAGLRLNRDLIEFCTERMPRWVPVSVAGYNGADSGLVAHEELGAVMANAVEYLDVVRDRGLPVDSFARGIGGVSFRTSMAFFEDIAKLRAARKMWHDLLRSRYGVTDEKALALRIHVVTAGSAMTYQQPINNLVRGTLMALAAALGGVQSLGVSGYDEAISIPSDHAHQMSIRIQQILQEECGGLVDVADPLGGSYFVESLTAELEQRAWAFFDEIVDRGGFVTSIDDGWLLRRAADNQLATNGEHIIVGVDDFTDDVTPWEIDGFAGGSDAWERGMDRVAALRRERHEPGAATALHALEDGCRGDANIVPLMLEALDADVTLGEIGAVYREAFGTWKAPVDL